MPRCAVVDCKNMGTHVFPKDVERRKLWEKALRRIHWKANRSSRLCAVHFKPEDYSEKNSYSGTPPKKNNAAPPENTPKKEESNGTETNNAPRNRSVRLKNRKAYLLNRRCSVPHCNSRPSNEISLHPCPNNAAVRNEWAEALRVSYQYVKNMVACSLHFSKIHFIQSSSSERVLKYNAVPSRNLPNRKMAMPVKQKPVKKITPIKAFERQQMMTDTESETKEPIQEETSRECRACLKKLDDKKSCCNVFQAWAPPWDGMEATIAEDLAKLANVEISSTDRHSKVLCAPCYQKLLDAAAFASCVRNCDLLLRMRFTADIDMDKVWPKPIQVDKNIDGSVFNNPMDIEIKQEVVSDDEYQINGTENPYVETELANLDIKIEPEELVEPPPMNITINGTISLDPLNSENKHLKNVTDAEQVTQYVEMEVKQEPVSEGEQEIELTPDMPLECLLCTKSFNSVTGLKAHVIAQHSYKTVKRKANGSVSPEKKRCDQHQCKICKRSFQTPTDLMVHETCHNKHACYGCTEKFDSFELLTRHRKRCKASKGNFVQKLKTLEDVKRPLPEERVEYLELEVKKIESETMQIKDEDIEMKELETLQNEDVDMEELNNEQKGSQVRSDNETVENDKNKLEYLNEEACNENKSESVREVDNDKQLQRVIEEDGNSTQVPTIIEEADNTNKLLSIVKEDDKNEQLPCLIEEADNTKQLLSVIEEDEHNKQLLSVVDDDTKQLLSVIEDDNTKQLLSVIEDDNTKQLLSVIDEDKNNKLLQCVIEEVENDIKLESMIVAESIVETESTNIESEHKEVEQDPDGNMKLHLAIHSTENETESVINEADMPVETLDNDDCT